MKGKTRIVEVVPTESVTRNRQYSVISAKSTLALEIGGEIFVVDDIVVIKAIELAGNGQHSNENYYKGRILRIDRKPLFDRNNPTVLLDCSRPFSSDLQEVQIEDIARIEFFLEE